MELSKKILASAMSVVMVVSLTPSVALAKEPIQQNSITMSTMSVENTDISASGYSTTNFDGYLVEWSEDLVKLTYTDDEENETILTRGTDYKIEKYEKSNDVENNIWETVESIESAGEYRAVLTGLDPYTGTNYSMITIVDDKDISTYGYHASGFTGSYSDFNVDLINLWYENPETEQDVIVEKGTAYEITGYQKLTSVVDDEETWGEAQSDISSYGVYRAVLTGKSPYYGTNYARLNLLNDKDISIDEHYRTNGYWGYLADWNIDKIKVEYFAKDSDENPTKALVLDTDYEVEKYQKYDLNDEEGTWVDNNEGVDGVGDYRVILKGKNEYSGNAYAYITIVSTNDIRGENFSITMDENTYNIYSWSDDNIVLEYDDGVEENKKTLTIRTDYEVSGYFKENKDTEECDEVSSVDSVGNYYIAIRGIGEYTGATTVSVKIVPADFKDATVSIENSDSLKATENNTEALNPGLSVKFGRNVVDDNDYTVSYYLKDTEDNYNLIEGNPKLPGDYALKLVSANDNYTNTATDYDAQFTVEKIYDISNGEVKNFTSNTTDGKTSLNATFDFYYNNTKLSAGTDYEIEGYYKKDSNTKLSASQVKEGGDYTLKLKGIDPYVGTYSYGFTYVSTNIKDVAHIVFANNNMTETDGTTTVSTNFDLYDSNNNKLILVTDYIILGYTDYNETGSYNTNTLKNASDIKKAGKYVVIVEGADKYTGQAVYDFEVKKNYDLTYADITATKEDKTNSAYNMYYTGSALNPVTKVEVAGTTLTYGTDYAVEMYDSNSQKIGEAKEIGEYTFKIVPGTNKNYTGSSSTQVFRILKKSESQGGGNGGGTTDTTPSITMPEKITVELGKSVVIPVTVKNDTTSVNYTLSNSTTVLTSNKSNAAITVTGNNLGKVTITAYTSSVRTTCEVEVVKVDITDATIVLSDDEFVYNGTQHKPKIKSVTLPDKTILDGVFYEVAYGDNVNAGDGFVLVKARDDSRYGGVATKKFNIEKATVTTPTSTTFVYDNAYHDAYSSTYDHYKMEGTLRNLMVGEYTAKAILDDPNNYMWEDKVSTNKNISWSITELDLNDADITIPNTSYVYTGSGIEPAVTVMKNGNIIPNTDYSVSYENNVLVGNDALVKVIAKNNCSGEYSTKFKITKAANTLTASAKKANLTYKAKNLKKKAKTVVNVKAKKAIGKVTYTNVSKNKTAKKWTVNSKTGKIKIAKKTKAGNYKVIIKVRADGDGTHSAKSVNVSFKVKVTKK